MPVFIKKHEVTNLEYRTFLSSLSDSEKLKYYPDTLRWLLDFPGSYNGPIARVYFYHPRYDNYPVVGVDYYDAMKFCKWFEERLQPYYSGTGYKIEVGLPNQFEWAFANGDHYVWDDPDGDPYYVNKFFDKDFITDLQIDLDSNFYSLLNHATLPGYANISSGNFIEDGYMYTTRYDFGKVAGSMVRADQINGIQFLNTNVSEWCAESYDQNWSGLFNWRQVKLRSLPTADALITAELEEHYNTLNDTISGQLIRGGNWLHEHHSMRNGQNVGTHDAKLFIDPDESHSTLGFRYVIRFFKLEDASEE